MARMGTPMYAPRQEARVFVTIYYMNGEVRVKLWRGRSKESIRRAAREFYTLASRIVLGNVMWITL